MDEQELKQRIDELITEFEHCEAENDAARQRIWQELLDTKQKMQELQCND